MRIFLTGSSGFLGSYIAEELVERGHTVICPLRSGTDPWRLARVRSALTMVAGDLKNRQLLHSVIVETRPEAIIHAAWEGVANSERNNPGQTENITAAARLAEAAAKIGMTVFIGLGSQAEYGPLNHAARELDQLRPTTLYGMAKAAAADFSQQICAAAGIRFAWLRVFSTYGPRDNECWLIPSLAATLLRGESPALTAGEQMWDFLHARDLARAVSRVLESPESAGCFNVGAGQAVSLRHTIEMLRDMIDPNLTLRFGAIPYRSDQVMHLEADISRIRTMTGWAPRVGLEHGLRETVDWLRGGR
jgi:nucleoside-diphosphate-sugar epimerase